MKIGISKDPEARLRKMQVSSPDELWLIAQVESREPESLETAIHNTLKGKHIHGEWYQLSSGDIDDLNDLMRMTSGELESIETLDQLERYKRMKRDAVLG